MEGPSFSCGQSIMLPLISTRGHPTRYSIERFTTVPGRASTGPMCVTRGAQEMLAANIIVDGVDSSASLVP